MFPNQRKTQYDSYPGNINVMTKFAAFIKSKLFFYSNQNTTSVSTVPHPVGGANLFMAWATSADSLPGYINSVVEYDPKRPVHALPHARYISYDTNPDPKVESYATAPYDSYTILMTTSNYRIQYCALSGPMGMSLFDFVRVSIFNDSFNAPFVKPIEL